MRKIFTAFSMLFIALTAISQQAQNTPETLIKKELQKSGFKNPEQISIAVSSSYVDAQTGIKHIYFTQTVEGLEIFNSASAIHLTQNGKILKFDNELIDNASNLISTKIPAIQAEKALEVSIRNQGMEFNASLNKSANLENGKLVWEGNSITSEKIYSKLGYFNLNGSIKLVYSVEFYQDETNDWWNVFVDANSSQILNQVTYTAHCNPIELSRISTLKNDDFIFTGDEESKPSLGKKASGESYNVFALPLESPAKGDQKLISNLYDKDASPYGWHDTNAVEGPEFTITRGNNVWAKDDTLGSNGTTGFAPDGGDSLVFDFTFDQTLNPRKSLAASVTNLFYMNNALHDIFHHYGFNEASGNFQQKNYTGLGKANDYVQGDAQDGSGTSNANFATPVDGSRPRMQMYLWPSDNSAAQNNFLYLNSPNFLASVYNAPQASFTPPLTKTPITADIVLVRDSNATTSNGCGLIANASEIAGKIALIDRGSCTNTVKVTAMQNLGAIAVIVAQTSTTSPTIMTGVGTGINIPAVQISKAHGDLIKGALKSGPVNATLADSSVASTAPVYDSDFDNGVIAHEYGHGISTRLTGGPNNSSCLSNAEQAGEGWSDFFALALTTREWEANSVSRGIGTYVFNQDSTGLGIRPYKYSRSMTINPVTYNSIKTLSQPHGIGFVFCSMLYDIYWDMIDIYGFDPDWYNGNGGNNKAMQLVIDGLKLQKCNPGFVDARNAILLADSINNGFAHKELLWRNFARRGLGFSADQKLNTSRSDGVQAFDLPGGITGTTEILKENDLRVYPNPSSDYFLVDIYGGGFIEKLEVFDINGKSILSKNCENKECLGTQIDMSYAQTGVYFLKVSSSKGSITKKLIVN